MDLLKSGENDGDKWKDLGGVKNPRDTIIQITISLTLGLGAFLTFCFLRPRWTTLYSARKKQRKEASPLPDLPDSFFGWMPVLYRITDQQVLASAGLDAYVFLAFFKLAIKFLTVTLFFALVVIKPVHDAFPYVEPPRKNGTDNGTSFLSPDTMHQYQLPWNDFDIAKNKPYFRSPPTDYLWMYLIFVYIFTGLGLYLIVVETEKVIGVRQEYLGHQTTITDRTIRLSGIPVYLRSEDKIKEFIENLEIGRVDSVMLCKNWKELDDLMDQRWIVLRKLEEAWTLFLGHERVRTNLESLPVAEPAPARPDVRVHDVDQEESDHEGSEAWETEHLLGTHGQHQRPVPFARHRPVATLRYGFMNLQSQKVDAIDHYEDKLKDVDDKIIECRKSHFDATPLAFVTMDSVASSQMAIQAVLDRSPLQLIASTSPTPADVVWRNTYLPRSNRMVRAWAITLLISVLTVFWSALLVPVATALNTKAIHRVWPQLADMLDSHEIAKSLVNTQLPTLVVTLLSVAVPYFYDWLANMQGMTSQGDVELSVISKNFFFTFFNVFIIFTVLGTATNFYGFFDKFGEYLKDFTTIAYTLAQSLSGLITFYVNLIILQGLGLFPFRLLEFGSVALYPIYRLGAKTPRDYDDLIQPPMFNYGFYLPQVILIFIICIIYSVLRDSWKVVLSGWAYFVIGSFVYKYQLLYAMDHRQRSTGRAWLMICNRIIVGILFFQLATAGQLALTGAYKRSAGVIPLTLGTLWFITAYKRSYEPLMRFIALNSIDRTASLNANETQLDDDENVWTAPSQLRWNAETRPGNNVDVSDETGTRFINPSLVQPLDDVWVSDTESRDHHRQYSTSGRWTRLESNLNSMF